MSTFPFLLEIGTEEVPDWMIPRALKDLRGLFEKLLEENGIGGTVDWVDATPRRLVLRGEGLLHRQPDSEELLTGPPKSAGGGAAAGFARKLGVSVEDLDTVTTPKGEYFSFRQKINGRNTIEILSDTLPQLILSIHFPKTMYWTGKGGARFIRPIRWIVALLGTDVVPFELAGVKSGKTTSGHRRLGKGAIPVGTDDYIERLRENFVLVSASERRRRIEIGRQALLEKRSLRVISDPSLLETLVNITEYPTPIMGGFNEQFLNLPSEVLTTVMRHHQKYFSVQDAGGELAPYFIAVMNCDADPDGNVRQGNERVLRARFNDARFFWDFDQNRKLLERVEDLAHVTYQAKLGSYLDKTKRVISLCHELATAAGVNPETVERAALLCKCDLTTEMVKEFTELQGVVGGLYARAQGESEEVWKAVYDHYKPQSMEDPIPSTPEGRVLSLADKVDTLRGCFEIGLVPTGSRDPFALRRAAQGVVKILVEGEMPLAVSGLCKQDDMFLSFMLDRVKYYFREVAGFAYDEVNAVLAADWDDLADAKSRLEAVAQVRPTENFEPLAASFKRIQNILRQASFSGGGPVDPSLLEEGPEADLHTAFLETRQVAEQRRLEKRYLPALESIALLRPKVDLFFDKVLVNAPDERVRRNRLVLLHSLLTESSTIADFSEIVIAQ